MSGFLGIAMPNAQMGVYATDALLDGLSRHLASMTSWQSSRGSHAQPERNCMRVTKPRSAGNSPRSSGSQARRRTMTNDSRFQHGARAVVNSALVADPSSYPPVEHLTNHERSELLHDCHMSYQFGQTQAPMQPPHQECMQPPMMQYSYAPSSEMDFLAGLDHLPPSPAVYSRYSSPTSALSPSSAPYLCLGQQQPLCQPNNWGLPTQQQAVYVDGLPSHTQLPDCGSELAFLPDDSVSALGWGSFAPAHAFDRSTAPPTPEDIVNPSQPEPRFQSGEFVPSEPLEDDESGGEILYGLGLYDSPEKPTSGADVDYHQTVVACLLGMNDYTHAPREPTGRGLKLEDAWEPPEEDADSPEGVDDAEGEEQDD